MYTLDMSPALDPDERDSRTPMRPSTVVVTFAELEADIKRENIR